MILPEPCSIQNGQKGRISPLSAKDLAFVVRAIVHRSSKMIKNIGRLLSNGLAMVSLGKFRVNKIMD